MSKTSTTLPPNALLAYREGWADGVKHGRAGMRKLIRRRLLRMAKDEDEAGGASYGSLYRQLAEIVTKPSREEPT